MQRACITGGAGFIGSNLADRLRAQGVEVAIVDDFRTGRREFVQEMLADPGVTLYEGDVLDGDLDPFMEAYLRWRRAQQGGGEPATG